jgi:hypothetical protein
MFLYRYSNLTVASTLPLVELAKAAWDSEIVPSFTCRLLSAVPADDDWIHHWQAQDDLGSLSLARTVDGFRLHFPGWADFVISRDGSQIGMWPAAGGSEETLRHLLLDQVLPRLLAHQGRLVLHAGAVCVDEQTVIFVGQTGWGKSTLTTSFHMAGYPLLSDDGLLLIPEAGSTLVLPTYPSLRLWPESIAGLYAQTPPLAPMAHYSAKQRVLVADGRTMNHQPMPIAALYVLAPPDPDSDAISVSRLSARETCMEIVRNSFQLDVTDHQRAIQLLDAASEVAQQLPAFRLTYPRDHALLPQVRAAILAQQDSWACANVDILAGQ